MHDVPSQDGRKSASAIVEVEVIILVLPGFPGFFSLGEMGSFSVRPQGGASWGSKLAPLLV